MTPVIVPFPASLGIAPNTCSWDLEGLDARSTSPLGGAFVDVGRPGARWKSTLQFKNLNAAKTRQLAAFLAQFRRAGFRSYIPNFAYVPGGSFGAVEIVSNNTFSAGSISGWAASGSTLSVNNSLLKVVNSGAAIGKAIATLTCVVGKSYCVRVCAVAGNVSAWGILIGTTSGGSEVSSQTYAAAGYQIITFTATATTHYLTFEVNTAVAGNYVFFGNISASQCPLVNGGSQTGNTLAIKGLPVSVNASLMAGDLIQLATGQVCRLTMDGDSDGSGNATLYIEASLRSSPAANSPVCLLTPVAPFAIATFTAGMAHTPPLFGSTSVDMLEDINLG